MAPGQMISVKDAYEAEMALGDPEMLHHCSLCNDTLPTKAFIAHIVPCVQARAPSGQLWYPGADLKGE